MCVCMDENHELKTATLTSTAKRLKRRGLNTVRVTCNQVGRRRTQSMATLDNVTSLYTTRPSGAIAASDRSTKQTRVGSK